MFTSIGGTISGKYDATKDEFTINADTLDLLFSRPLYWKETDSSTSPIYKIVNGTAEPDPNDTSKGVGIQYTKLANDPTVTMTPNGGLYQLKFDATCGLSGTRFTLLNYGKIYAQDGTYGTKTSGITIDISLGEEVYDNNKGAYFRTPTITVTYDGGQKSKTGEPIEVRKPEAPKLTGAPIKITPQTGDLLIEIDLQFSQSIYKADKTPVTDIASSFTKGSGSTGTATISGTNVSGSSTKHTVKINHMVSNEETTFVLSKDQVYGLGATQLGEDITITVKQEPVPSGVLTQQKVTVTVSGGGLAQAITKDQTV